MPVTINKPKTEMEETDMAIENAERILILGIDPYTGEKLEDTQKEALAHRIRILKQHKTNLKYSLDNK